MKAESMKQVVDMMYPNLDETMAELEAKEKGKNMKWEELCDQVRELLPEEEYGSVMVEITAWSHFFTKKPDTVFAAWSDKQSIRIQSPTHEGLIQEIKQYIQKMKDTKDQPETGIEL